MPHHHTFGFASKIGNPPFTFFISFMVIALAVVGVYANSLNAPFFWDDYNYVVGNPAIEMSALSIVELKKAALESRLSNRVVPNISFALNYYFLGAEARGFHVINIIIHICTSFIVFLLLRVTLKLPPLAERFPRHQAIALGSALLWAVHPLQTNGVTYIVQRMTSLVALFYLSSMLLYIYGRLAPTLRSSLTFYFLALICGIGALLSKENSAMLPFMIVAYEFFFLRDFNWRRQRKILGISFIVLVLFLTATVFFYLGDPLSFLQGYQHRDFTLLERQLTESRVVLFYLSLIVLPLPSRLNLLHDIPLSTGLFTPPQTVAAVLCIIIAVMGVVFCYKRHRLIAFVILWFFANLVIESSLIPLEIIYEHRTYLPSIFIIMALCAYAFKLERLHKMLPVVGVSLLIITLAGFTWQRNALWSQTTVLWQDVVNKSPNLARGYSGMYFSLQAKGQTLQAKQYLAKALAINPAHKRNVVSMARLNIAERRYEEALEVLNAFLAQRQTSNILEERAIVYGFLNKPFLAEKDAEKAAALNPKSTRAFLTLGVAQMKQHKYGQALDNLQKTMEVGGVRSPLALSLIGEVYLNQGDTKKAIDYFEEALGINPNHPTSHYNLGRAYDQLGMKKAAAKEKKLGLSLQKRPQPAPTFNHNF